MLLVGVVKGKKRIVSEGRGRDGGESRISLQ